MKKQLFNSKWRVESGVKDPFVAKLMGSQETEVVLPHDAMIYEERSAECSNGYQSGFYPSGSYTYTKTFTAPEEWREMQIQIEFEGVMSKAMVYVNEILVTRNAYGYSQFYADIKPYLNFGSENKIKVVSINQDKSSRWYSGSGIYRDVNLYTGGSISIQPEGIRITTVDIEDDYAVLCIDSELKSSEFTDKEGVLQIQLEDPEGNTVVREQNRVTVPNGKTASSHMRVTVPKPDLWSPEQPVLYTCKAVFFQNDIVVDEAEEQFGIRQLKLDARKGLRINGRSVKLRGACIHHDNGVIGACTLEMAEEYRCRKLKEAGFNSIRSAHHPIGKAMLRVCDRLGILVMDELCDMWNTLKNCNDFGFYFQDHWEREVERMVSKDYNHPCVIMYSVGNEVPEIGRSGGRIQNREIAVKFRSEDPTRFVTSGINGVLALSGAEEEEQKQLEKLFMHSEEYENSQSNTTKINKSEGSEKLNDVMGDTSYEERDRTSSHPIMTKQLEEACGELDVIGLNYMPTRHALESELHPDHIVVGSESFPGEIPQLWKIVEDNPHVIGDYTWTGYDYLGEAGIGSYHYDVIPEGQGTYPDRLAYCGDINLNGYRRPVSYLREIVFGLRKEPFISVERVNRYGCECVRNHWKYGDEVDSWTFPGYENHPARLRVLSGSEEVELYLNGISLGKKMTGPDHNYTAVYELTYRPGELVAVGYDKGQETGRVTLTTAGTPAKIHVNKNTDVLHANEQDALILDISLTDESGTVNMWEEKDISIAVKGPLILQGFGNANPSSEGSFGQNVYRTFDGRVIAVFRTSDKAGNAKITIMADGIEEKVLSYSIL